MADAPLSTPAIDLDSDDEQIELAASRLVSHVLCPGHAAPTFDVRVLLRAMEMLSRIRGHPDASDPVLMARYRRQEREAAARAALRSEQTTFMRLPDGHWGVRGDGLQPGAVVNVKKKGGEVVSVVIGYILGTDEHGFTVATIQPSETPADKGVAE